MLKKSISVSALVYASASAMAQAPMGSGMIPGGGESSMQPPVVRSRTASTIDARPLADASTPYACACAEFEIDEFLAASVQATATPTSLPGLGEQTAEFLQNQGGDSGGAPSALGDGEGGGSESPLHGGDPNPGAAQAGDGLAAAAGEDRGDGAESPVNGEAPDPGAAQAGDGLAAAAGEERGDGAESPVNGEAPDLGAAQAVGGLAAAAGEDRGDGDDSGAQSFSASLPADLEENSPVPQPFLLSSIVNVDVAASAQNSSGSGAASSSEQDDAESESSRNEAEAEAFEDAANEEG